MQIDSYVDAEWQGTKPTRDSVLADIRAGRRSAVAEAALLSYADLVALGNVQGEAEAHAAVAHTPTVTTTPPATVTAAGRARVREIQARVNAADAKAALLDEISRKHGQAAAKAAQDLSIDALVKRAAAPSREAIAESWTRALRRAGATVQTAPTNGPKAAAQSNSWDRVWLSKGFELDPSAGRRPAALHSAGIVAPSPRGR